VFFFNSGRQGLRYDYYAADDHHIYLSGPFRLQPGSGGAATRFGKADADVSRIEVTTKQLLSAVGRNELVHIA